MVISSEIFGRNTLAWASFPWPPGSNRSIAPLIISYMGFNKVRAVVEAPAPPSQIKGDKAPRNPSRGRPARCTALYQSLNDSGTGVAGDQLYSPPS